MGGVSKSFTERVAYARLAILRNEDSRAHDNCFEMYDGALVVTALMRQAETDPHLLAAIKRQFSIAGIGLWETTAAEHAHIPTHKLPDAARIVRRKERAAFDLQLKGWQAAQAGQIAMEI